MAGRTRKAPSAIPTRRLVDRQASRPRPSRLRPLSRPNSGRTIIHTEVLGVLVVDSGCRHADTQRSAGGQTSDLLVPWCTPSFSDEEAKANRQDHALAQVPAGRRSDARRSPRGGPRAVHLSLRHPFRGRVGDGLLRLLSRRVEVARPSRPEGWSRPPLQHALSGTVRIAWRAYGHPGRPNVALLHSLGLDAAMWDEQVVALERDYRVITMDTRGHGLSDAPAGAYSLEELADDVLSVAAAAGAERFHVAGLSLGRAAGALAGRTPRATDRVGRPRRHGRPHRPAHEVAGAHRAGATGRHGQHPRCCPGHLVHAPVRQGSSTAPRLGERAAADHARHRLHGLLRRPRRRRPS